MVCLLLYKLRLDAKLITFYHLQLGLILELMAEGLGLFYFNNANTVMSILLQSGNATKC